MHLRTVRTLLAVLATALLALFGVAAPASAASLNGSGNPHFIYVTPQLVGNDLQVNFKEAGVGSGASVTVSTTATFSFTLGCINGGSKHPKAANKEAFSTTESASGTFTANAGGNVVSSLTLTAPSTETILSYLVCPPGQTTTLFSAGWSNLSITDSTNHITINVPGTWSVM
jgi:hypothetical protein